MWIRFDFKRDVNTQIRLHRIFRSKISEWTKSELIDGQILTYHFEPNRRSSDSLYLCLSLPSVKPPQSRSEVMARETLDRIPSEIHREIDKINKESLGDPRIDALDIFDYEIQLSPKMYSDAPIAEILNFASKGTGIALEVLNASKTRNSAWKNDQEIIETISTQTKKRLHSEREQLYGLHFSCNSIFLAQIIEMYLRNVLSRRVDGGGHYAIDFLYDIEKNGDFARASKHLIPLLGLL